LHGVTTIGGFWLRVLEAVGLHLTRPPGPPASHARSAAFLRTWSPSGRRAWSAWRPRPSGPFRPGPLN
jgi:hypothetical protein